MTKEDFIKLIQNSGRITMLNGNETLLVIADGQLRESSVKDIRDGFYKAGTQEVEFDGTQTTISIPHTLGSIPSATFIQFADLTDSNIASFTYEATINSIDVTFQTAPNPGSNIANFTVFK